MLNVIYRPCGTETHSSNLRPDHLTHRPPWFSKFNIYKSILISLLTAKEHINKFYIFYDGSFKGEFYDYIISTFSIFKKYNIDYEFREINQNSVYGSVMYASTFAANNLFDTYIVEDDYLHKPDSILNIVKALPKYQLISLYDHWRQYIIFDEWSHGGYEIKVDFDINTNSHWRTSKTVGHTYAVSKQILSKYGKSIISSDTAVRSDWELWKMFYSVNVPVWVSIPGMVTQVDPWMSPGVDWESINNFILHTELT